MKARDVRAHGGAPACSALTPSPSPTAWERGACIAYFGVLKRQLQQRRKLSRPHSTIPLSRLRERGTQGVRAIISVFALVFQHAPPPNLPRGRGRSRGSLLARGEGWGGGYAQISLQRHLPIARAEFTIAPLLQVPPASRGEPRKGSVPPHFARGTRARVRFPQLAGGTLRRGSSIPLFLQTCPRDWYRARRG